MTTDAVHGDDVVAQLREHLGRYPPERYPVQHATGCFHLGAALLQAGRAEEALPPLRAAVRLFASTLPVEHAKALNMFGVALRGSGRMDEALEVFAGAAAALADSGQQGEAAAARFNLGLVHLDRGDAARAAACFAEAEEQWAAQQAPPGTRAAAARERGRALLQLGDVDGAIDSLGRAVALADEAGDTAGVGASANDLGLARLAGGDPVGAVEALRRAAGAHPRSLRPHEHAMAKANLALAHERAGEAPRARLSARQARSIPAAPAPVLVQADEVLQRLGDRPGDLVAVLDDEPTARWTTVLREEVARWLDVAPEVRRREVRRFAEDVGSRRGTGPGLVQAWLQVLLELPTEAMQCLLRTLLEELGALERPGEAFRDHLARALPRLHPPQWQRVEGILDQLGRELGRTPGRSRSS